MSSANPGSYRALKSPSKPTVAHHALDIDGDLKEKLRSRSLALSSSSSQSIDHESRFLSGDEWLLASHPLETRRSFAALNDQDRDSWHALQLDEVARRLKADFETGLDYIDHERRLEQHGANELEREPRTPVYIVFLLQFYNLIIAMLLAAAVLALCFQEFVDGLTILFIVVLNSCVATYQEHSAGNALEALAHMSSPQSVVLRDGTQQAVDSSSLVPGDVVLLVTGDIVPADLRLVECSDLKVNEMLLTGESEDVSKSLDADKKSSALTAANMAFSSTTVTGGNARGVVVATGMKTRVGAIAALLKSNSSASSEAGDSVKKYRNPIADCVDKHQPKQTPLQASIHRLGMLMGVVGIAVCVVVYVVGYWRGNTDAKHPDRPVWLNMIMVAVSLAVTAVPEGLPVVVTICLSSGTLSMVGKNVLVRRLTAVETLGAASVICTDKTGTLTEGKMTAVKLWADFSEYNITGKGSTPEGAILLDGVRQSDNQVVRATLLASVLCSNTRLQQVEVDEGDMAWQAVGNSTEAPLVVAAAKAGIWGETAGEQYKRVVELPFSSTRKMMATVNELPVSRKAFDLLPLDSNNDLVACVKGAPNYVVNACTQYCTTDGSFAELSIDQRAKIMRAVDELSSRALRVLAVAIRPMQALPFSRESTSVDHQFATLARDMTFLGLVASIDPERNGILEAVRAAQAASIRTVMITGDYLKTAAAIAKNVGLLDKDVDSEVGATDCEALRPGNKGYLPDHELDAITARTLVFARAKPEDKIAIVKSLQRQGLISAMTGDGVNDAPALKAADIGVAMGISGTEVAKGASDMILTDDNFVSIVAAVEQGRAIYANIQKFVLFFLSANFGLIPMMFAAIAAGIPLPMEALQILMLNLFSNGMPAVALSLEQGDPKLMESPPRPKTQPLIHGKRMWTLVAFNASLIAVGSLAAFLLGLYWNFGLLLQSEILQGDGLASSVTCNRWDGVRTGWRLYGNCAAQFGDDSFVFGGIAATSERFQNATVFCEGGDYDCVAEGVARSQTLTFVTLTFTEVVMAYTLRSFSESSLRQPFANKFLNMASLMAIGLAVVITNVPVIMDDLFDFAYMPWWQWCASAAIAVLSGVCNEAFKPFLRRI